MWFVFWQSLRKTRLSFGAAGFSALCYPHLSFEVTSFSRGQTLPPSSAGPAFEGSHLFPYQAPEQPEPLSGSRGRWRPVPL